VDTVSLRPARDRFCLRVKLLYYGAFAFFDYCAGDAVLAGFLFYQTSMLGHSFGRAFGFDLGGCCVQLNFSFRYCFGFDSYSIIRPHQALTYLRIQIPFLENIMHLTQGGGFSIFGFLKGFVGLLTSDTPNPPRIGNLPSSDLISLYYGVGRMLGFAPWK
jgi:hypothetical protein